MNDHQLLCFLTVQRILNFTAAAKELYCTQPALSYQIRSLEKELDLTLFERSTTRVVLTAAGRAFVPHAEQLYRGILNARTALKGFSAGHTLTLRLPPVLLQHDPIYPVLMERLHTVLPGHEFRVDTAPPRMNAHLMLCTEADAAVVLPFGSAQPEVERTPIMHNTFYLALAPEHPLYPRESLQLADLAGQRVYYEPLYQEIVDYAGVQPGMPFSTMEWRSVENYAHVYTELLAGRGMFLFPMRYPCLPGSVVPAGMAAPAGHRSADLAGRSPPGDCHPAPGVHRGLRREDKSIDPIKNGTSAAVPFFISPSFFWTQNSRSGRTRSGCF